MLLDYIRRLQIDVVSLEDLVAAEVLARGIRDRFKELDMKPPNGLSDKLRQIERAITAKIEEQRALEARQILIDLDRLKTQNEKRAELQKRLKELKPYLDEVEAAE